MSELATYTVRVGSGLDAFYVGAVRVAEDGALCLGLDDEWRAMPVVDDCWGSAKAHRRSRFAVGDGVFQIGAGPVRAFRDGVLVLDLSAVDQGRSHLVQAELLADGKAVARFRSGRWYYRDRVAEGSELTLGPASLLGVPETTPAGPLFRPSALAEATP